MEDGESVDHLLSESPNNIIIRYPKDLVLVSMNPKNSGERQ